MAAANELGDGGVHARRLVVAGAADRARLAVHGQPRLGRHPHVGGHALVALQRHVPALPEPEDRPVRGRDRLDAVLPRAGRAGARQAALLGEEGPDSSWTTPPPTSTSTQLDIRETFRDHVFGCFIEDHHGIASLDEIGEDNIMCETDYPHSDSTWPDCIDTARRIDQGPARGRAVQAPAGQRRAAVPVHAGRAARAGERLMQRPCCSRARTPSSPAPARASGRASALRFAEEGAEVVCADLDVDGAKETVRLDRGGRRHRRAVRRRRLRRRTRSQPPIGAAVEHFGRLDIVFNNVGIPTPRLGMTFEEHTAEDFERLFAVNVGGVFLGCKHAVLRFKEQGDRRRDPQHRLGRRPRRLGRHGLRRHQGRGAPAHQGGRRRGGAVRHPGERHLPGGACPTPASWPPAASTCRTTRLGRRRRSRSGRATRSAGPSPPRTAPRPPCSWCRTGPRNITGVLAAGRRRVRGPMSAR